MAGLAVLAGCASATGVQVERDVAVPMRDGVVLRADIYRPAGDGKFPVLVFRTPYGKHNAAEQRRRPRESRRARLCGGHAGRARPLRIGRPLRSVPAGRRGRLRHDRVGGEAALVRRPGRDLRPFVPGRGAMARRAGGAAASPRHGARDDILLAAPVLLHERHLRPVVAAVDLREHRAGRATPARLAGRMATQTRSGGPSPATTSRGCRCATCRGCARKRRTTSSGCRIRPRTPGGTGRSSRDATAGSRPPC